MFSIYNNLWGMRTIKLTNHTMQKPERNEQDKKQSFALSLHKIRMY